MRSLVPVSAFRIARVASAILVCSVLASCGKAPKQALRLNLAPGTTYVLAIRVAADAVLTTVDGNNIPVPASSQSSFVLRAGDVDERGDTFVSAEAGESEFPMMFLPLAAIFKGYNFGIKISPVGRISEFVNTEAMRQGIRESLRGMEAAAAVYGKTSVDLAAATISDDALRAMIEPITSIWPETPVSPGDEWTGPAIYSPIPHTITTARYRLKSRDDAEATITMETEERPAGSHARDPNFPPPGEISGKGTGEIRVDTLRGTIRSYELDQVTSGTIRTAEGVEFKVTGSSRVQAELTAR